MPKAIEADDFNPKKIYESLIARCKEAKAWYIGCIVDESFVGPAPFDIIIQDGVFICKVIAPTKRDALIMVANSLPVIKFFNSTEYDE